MAPPLSSRPPAPTSTLPVFVSVELTDGILLCWTEEVDALDELPVIDVQEGA